MTAVARSRIQDDIHPVLRHPRPIKRDFAKAHQMLGLVAQDEEKSKALRREKSVTTRWLERPMYEHLSPSGTELDKEEMDDESKADSVLDEKRFEAEVHPLLRPASFSSVSSTSIKPTIMVDTFSLKRRPELPKRSRPTSYNVQHLTVPDCTLSPGTTSPKTQRPRPLSLQPSRSSSRKGSGSSTSGVQLAPQGVYTEKWMASPIDCGANMRSEQPASFQQQNSDTLDRLTAGPPRPRPTSFATYSHQRNRSNGKIASSRGFRNNSYPNFTRPISGIAPRAIPGEQMETEMVSPRSNDDRFGPNSPLSPMSTACSGSQPRDDNTKTEKKRRSRWSTIPDTLKKFTRRRSSTAAQEPPAAEIKVEAFRRMNVTEGNLHYNKSNAIQRPSTPDRPTSNLDLLPTPVYSPLTMNNSLFETQLPRPFAPWTGGPPSPASTMDRSSVSGASSLSPTRKTAPSRLSFESVSQVRPASLHSRNSLVVPSPTGTAPQPRHSITDAPLASPCASSPRASRRGTPSLERTCILCRTTKSPSDFISRRITPNCWHETATCLGCLQSWIETCIKTQGLDRCTCPECSEMMANEDVAALMHDATHPR